MPTSPLDRVIQHLKADLGPDGDGLTDGELLARFLSSRDDAVAALVRRHAPMVWGVCRRLLNHHDAEDAFQATFLVLVRKAADVPRQAVANWLYGVARQTAVRLRATAAKRGRRETQVTNMPEPTVAEARDADLQAVLDEELSRLPDHYRGVLVLCDLEGLTRKEAARQFGIPEGSVASRLARARVLLAKRLAQRGLFSGGSLAAVLSAGSASASAPPALVASTIQAVSLLAAGKSAATGVISARVAALTEGMVKTMFVTRIKGVLAVALVLAALAGAGGLIYQAQAAERQKAKEPSVNVSKYDGKVGIPKDAGQQSAQPKQQPAQTDQERMVGNWYITNDESMRKGEMWVITKDSILMHAKNTSPIIRRYAHRLDAGKDPRQIDITVTRVNGPLIGVMKGIYVFDGDELRLCLGALGKDRPAAFARKPGPGEVLIFKREEKLREEKLREKQLRVLIDKVLAAHGGEDRLNKLQFTMTVKHSNGETQQYFVQPPRHFRWETTHRDQTGARIVILFPEGRRWWTKEPNKDAREFRLTGIEPPVAYWFDNVKFFGPRQVLRLKDAGHKVALLNEEARIGGRAAVGVEVTGPHFKGRMYFDKVTHLLVKRTADSYYRSHGFITYSDYKKFDGIPVAQKEHDGYFMPVITDFRAVDRFNARLFERP